MPKEKGKMIIISYIPLLWGPGRTKLETPEKITEFFTSLDEISKHVQAPKACLWAGNKDGSISPIFVTKDAHEVAAHLEGWTENNVKDWFEACIVVKEDKYFIVLWPNLEKSKDRHLYNWTIRNEEIILEDEWEFNFLFHPFYFRSETRGTIDQVLEILKDATTICIGFLDEKDFDPQNPTNNIKPQYVGPVPLRLKHKLAEKYVDDLDNLIKGDT